MTKIVNSTRNLMYWDVNRCVLLTRDEALASVPWVKVIHENSLRDHRNNATYTTPIPQDYTPIAGLIPVPAKTSWNLSGSDLSINAVLEPPWKPRNVSIADFEAVANKYRKLTAERPIAIELSGGLDTSVIIDIARAIGMNFVLVGTISKRYEFRTERLVQDLMCADDPTAFIEEDEVLYFTRLKDVPLHAQPSSSCITHWTSHKIADAASKLGARFVLNGTGGDQLFACDIRNTESDYSMPDVYRGWALYSGWTDDNVYKPKGMRYVPSYSLWPVPQYVWSMRRECQADPQKWFARKLFKGRLPRELTEFAYKAGFEGSVYDGARVWFEDIVDILRTAEGIGGLGSRDVENTVRKLENIVHQEKDSIDEIFQTVSFAAWIYALIRDGYL